MDFLKDAFYIVIGSLVVIYAVLKYSLYMMLSPRSRRELTCNLVGIVFICGLLLAIPILAENVNWNSLLTLKPDPVLVGIFLIVSLLIMRFCQNYRLRFKGEETALLERTETYLNFIFNDGGRYTPGKDRKVYRLTYQYIVDGKTYHGKKYITGGKINYLTRVLYDPAKPSRHIPVPGKDVDGIKY